ncbi:putative inactive G-type lectin S-receptor-like serine/threonine-protein kinase SRK [Miscanthus floridulus]|uniref:putative inactive G-type lectin S-receptor-like serine/threonine-protein kinase SRK n=1 Tax=Miscanthus floridulus TaxID=154761 RepID=UPI00345791FC
MASLYMLICGLLLSSSLHTPPAAMAHGSDSLSVGQTLVVGEKLISRNGKFALGFFQFQPAPGTSFSKSPLSSLGWYLGIWFNKIPVFTPVWIANREKPITYPELKISRDGNLIIAILNNNASTAESILWSTAHFVVNRSTAETSTNTTSTAAAAAAAVLMDNGNLALIVAGSSSSNGTSLWQSFDYPTDVGLPGAKLGWNKVTGLNRRFISKKNLIDPGLGSYILELDSNGVLSHRRRKPPFVVYLSWSSGKLAYTLVHTFNGLLDSDARTKGLLVPKYVNNHEEYFTYESLDESSSTFVSIDVSGQIKLNIWSQEKHSWQTVYAQPADPCSLPAVCGPFTVCDGNASPLFCSCMESFSPNSPLDWEAGNPTGGCVRSIPLECTASNNNKNMASSSSDMFHTIARVTYPRYIC